MKTEKVKNLKILLVFIFLCTIYFVVWKWLAHPYRLFPSDDFGEFLKFLNTNTILDAFNTRMPVFFVAIKMFSVIKHCFSTNALLNSTLLANSVILFFLSLIIYKVTKNFTTAILGALIYGTSGWPANYYFFFSYAPFTTMLMILALFFILKTYTTNRVKLFMIVSGCITGLFFWSSPSAAVMVMLLFLMVCYLNKENNNNFRQILPFLILLICTILIFAYNSGHTLVEHFRANISSEHYIHAFEKFGYIPKTPFFSFFHIMGIYNKFLLVIFLICSIFIFMIYTKDKIARIKTDEFKFDEKKFLYIFIIVIWVHGIIIDILPFTKLGRTHFVVYPLVIIIIASAFSYILKKRKFLLSTRILIGCVVGAIIALNINFSAKLVHSKTAIPKFLMKNFNPKIQDIKISRYQDIYTVNDDPHFERLMLFLVDFNIRNEINMQEFIYEKLPNRKNPIGLILGPQGNSSGLSIMKHCVLNDFFIKREDEKILFERAKIKVILPYYSKFPSFMMEEEICQALYFEGNIDAKDNNVTFLYFE